MKTKSVRKHQRGRTASARSYQQQKRRASAARCRRRSRRIRARGSRGAEGRDLRLDPLWNLVMVVAAVVATCFTLWGLRADRDIAEGVWVVAIAMWAASYMAYDRIHAR